MEVYQKPIFKFSVIPDVINGVTLSEQDRKRLSFGRSSGLLRNMVFANEEVRDGKICLSRDEAGQLEINYMFQKLDTTILKQLENFQIPETDKIRLLNNETVGPFLLGEQLVFLQVDHELNRIASKSGHELNVPKKITGYSLTAEDMNILANRGKMPPRLFNIEGKYYTAEIGMTSDQRGLFLHNLTDQSHLSAEQLKELEGALNPPATPLLPLVLSPDQEAERALKKKQFTGYSLKPVGDLPSADSAISVQQEIFRDAVDNYRLDVLANLKQSGFLPDDADKEYIRNNINLDNDEKKMTGTVLEINHQEVSYDEYNRPDHVSHTQLINKDEKETDTSNTRQPDQVENTEKKNFQTPDSSVDNATAQRIGNIITTAFDGM